MYWPPLQLYLAMIVLTLLVEMNSFTLLVYYTSMFRMNTFFSLMQLQTIETSYQEIRACLE